MAWGTGTTFNVSRLQVAFILLAIYFACFFNEWLKERSFYVGERDSRGNRHGQGVYNRTINGVTEGYYEGQWRDDKKHGRGKSIRPGEIYEGEWLDGEASGQGTRVRSDHRGQKYEGQWRRGSFTGKGCCLVLI